MQDAVAAGIPIDTYAKLVGVSRQTLYRWREAVEGPPSKMVGRRTTPP